MKRSIVLNANQSNFLEREAERLGITVSEMIRRIIHQYQNLYEIYGSRWLQHAIEKNVYELLNNMEERK